MMTAKEAKQKAQSRAKEVFEENCSLVRAMVLNRIGNAVNSSNYHVSFNAEEIHFTHLATVIPELKKLGYTIDKTDQIFRVSWE